MKLFCLFVFSFFTGFTTSFSQVWTQEQLDLANTANSQIQLTKIEKEAIMYLNLARLYPKQFAVIEVENYFGTDKYVNYVKNSIYRQTLIVDLLKRDSVQKLYFDSTMYSSAKCFSKESGEQGIIGHARTHCTIPKGAFGECCSYGMETGKDIVMQLLIDDNIPEVGHRITCLEKKYSKIGLSVSPHKTWGTCAILDFSY